MTPAQTTNVTAIGTSVGTYRVQYPIGSPWTGWMPGSDIPTTAAVDVKLRPQSVTNPIRADGTRGVASWNHRWAGATLPHREVIYQYTQLPWQLIQYRQVGPTLDGCVAWKTWQSALTGCGCGFAAGSGPFPYGIESRARTKFLLALADGKADLGVALGEIRQTAGLVTSAAQSMGRAIDSVVAVSRGLPKAVLREILNFGRIPPRRRREPSQAYRRRVARERAVLNRWLEYQFGVKPLIQDIQDAGQALSDAIFEEELPLSLVIKKGAGESSAGEVSRHGAFGAGAVYWDVRAEFDSACHISARYEVPLGSTARAYNQLGLLNVASLAWELTLYSWMADYLSTVGSWLSSLSASSGTVFVEGTITKIQRVHQLDTRFRASYPYSIIKGGEWAGQPLAAGNMTRDVLSSVAPAYRPTVHNRLNLTKMANVLSVLALKAKLT